MFILPFKDAVKVCCTQVRRNFAAFKVKCISFPLSYEVALIKSGASIALTRQLERLHVHIPMPSCARIEGRCGGESTKNGGSGAYSSVLQSNRTIACDLTSSRQAGGPRGRSGVESHELKSLF